MIRKLGLRVTLLFGIIIFIVGFYYLYSTASLFDYFCGTTLLGIGFTFLATVPVLMLFRDCLKNNHSLLVSTLLLVA